MKHETILKKKYEENIDEYDYDFQRLRERANNDAEEMYVILLSDITESIVCLTTERYYEVYNYFSDNCDLHCEEPSEEAIERSKKYTELYDRICSDDFSITFENIRMAHYEYEEIE
tara:strand:- start:2124 stop:2471 length:348 start_codon:yes stop_codon:yes gene_type:complete